MPTWHRLSRALSLVRVTYNKSSKIGCCPWYGIPKVQYCQPGKFVASLASFESFTMNEVTVMKNSRLAFACVPRPHLMRCPGKEKRIRFAVIKGLLLCAAEVDGTGL